MARKKKVDGRQIVGRLITLFFVLLLIGGAYYLFTLFKTVEINSENMTGTWKAGKDPVVYYVFSMDETNSLMAGKLTRYEQRAGSPERENEQYYKYTMEINDKGRYEVFLQPYNKAGKKNGDVEKMKITGLSRAQMYIQVGKNKDTALMRVGIF